MANNSNSKLTIKNYLKRPAEQQGGDAHGEHGKAKEEKQKKNAVSNNGHISRERLALNLKPTAPLPQIVVLELWLCRSAIQLS